MKIVKVKKEVLNKILSHPSVHEYDYFKSADCYQIYVWDRKGNFHVKQYKIKN